MTTTIPVYTRYHETSPVYHGGAHLALTPANDPPDPAYGEDATHELTLADGVTTWRSEHDELCFSVPSETQVLTYADTEIFRWYDNHMGLDDPRIGTLRRIRN